MKMRAAGSSLFLSIVAVVMLSSTAACSGAPEELSSEGASAITAPVADGDGTTSGDGDIDLGCPDDTSMCGAELDTSLAVASAEVQLGGGIHTLDEKPGTFVQSCVAKLKAAGGAAAKTVKICAYSIAVCAALTGNANGTQIQQFCAALAKVASCRGKAEEEAKKAQDAVCPYCKTIAACGGK